MTVRLIDYCNCACFVLCTRLTCLCHRLSCLAVVQASVERETANALQKLLGGVCGLSVEDRSRVAQRMEEQVRLETQQLLAALP